MQNSVNQADTTVYVAVDMNDPLLDSVETFERFHKLLKCVNVKIQRLPPAYSGNICWMWAELAVQATSDGADPFVLVGDDVVFQEKAWRAAVESQFQTICQQTGLPFPA